MSDFRFSRHAVSKFAILKRHGFEVTQNQVGETVSHPHMVIPKKGNKWIAQKAITDRHVMKVSYDREEDILLIETVEKGNIDHAEHTGPFIAHFGQSGQLILLEVLDASEFIATLLTTT